MLIAKNGRWYWLKTTAKRSEVYDITDPREKRVVFAQDAESRSHARKNAIAFVKNTAFV
jgi:hypothetical protein